MTNSRESASFFDIPTAVDQYRRAVELRDAQPTTLAREHQQALIDRLVADWIAANGGDKDELHEIAFGGPPEENENAT